MYLQNDNTLKLWNLSWWLSLRCFRVPTWKVVQLKRFYQDNWEQTWNSCVKHIGNARFLAWNYANNWYPLKTAATGFTFDSSTLGYTNYVNVLILGKHILHRDWLLHVFANPVNLLRDGSTIHLDLHNVSFLLTLLQQFCLGVTNSSDHSAVLLHLVEVSLNLLLASLIIPLEGSLGECLLLGAVPWGGWRRTCDKVSSWSCDQERRQRSQGSSLCSHHWQRGALTSHSTVYTRLEEQCQVTHKETSLTSLPVGGPVSCSLEHH